MNDKVIKTPGPDHPMSIDRWAVRVAGRTIVDTRNALVLREAKYPPVFYVPRSDTDMSALERSEQTTYCPYKGDCAYFSIPMGGDRSKNAVWTYEAPHAAAAEIKGHLAFYPERVDSIGES